VNKLKQFHSSSPADCDTFIHIIFPFFKEFATILSEKYTHLKKSPERNSSESSVLMETIKKEYERTCIEIMEKLNRELQKECEKHKHDGDEICSLKPSERIINTKKS